MTGCVGNILDDLSSPMSANSRRQSQMEFTNCVGSILAQISQEEEEEEGSLDMEMTQSVGSLVLPSVNTNVNINVNTNANSNDNMEMTQPIGSLIIERAVQPQIDVSFIEDCAQPAAFNLMSPSKQSESDTETCKDSNQASQLSQQVYTVESENAVEAENMEISEAVDRESVKIAQEAVAKSSEEMFQVFSVNTASINNSNMSSTSSAAVASLKEFLNESGVRFLDNLSNMGRRDTVGKPRDSTIITPARSMYIRSVLVPETLAIEKACGECIHTIEAQRQFLVEEEGKFNHHPPLAYRELLKNPMEAPERLAVLQKLKTLKSVARLFARQSWYEWRKGFEANFEGELIKVLANLKLEYSSLEGEKCKLQAANCEEIEPKCVDLQRELSHLKARYDSLSRSDWEEASELHEQVMRERQKATALDQELADTLAQETALRQNIEGVLEQRRALQETLCNLKHSCAQFEDCTELALTELKSTFALQEALNGWKLVQLRESSIAWEYTRGTPTNPIQIRMNWSSASFQVTSVLIESEYSTLATLRPASQLIVPQFCSLPASVTSVLCQLDALVQLSRELSLIKVQCDVQLLSVVATNDTNQLPLLLTFFNFQAKIKFDVIIGFSLNTKGQASFKLLSFQNHYGPVSKEQVAEAVKEDYGLRRIVNTISTFLK